MKPVQHEVVVRVPELTERSDQIKRHFEQNKKLYYTGIGGFVLGYILRRPKMITVVNSPTIVVTGEVPE